MCSNVYERRIYSNAKSSKGLTKNYKDLGIDGLKHSNTLNTEQTKKGCRSSISAHSIPSLLLGFTVVTIKVVKLQLNDFLYA